jgi:hypothetical protein
MDHVARLQHMAGLVAGTHAAPAGDRVQELPRRVTVPSRPRIRREMHDRDRRPPVAERGSQPYLAGEPALVSAFERSVDRSCDIHAFSFLTVHAQMVSAGVALR